MMTADQIAHMEKRLDRETQDLADDYWREEFMAEAERLADWFMEPPC